MGNFCKVFAAYKQVKDSRAYLYQIAGILLLLSTTKMFDISQKIPFLPFLNLSGVIKWNMLNFMLIVYIGTFYCQKGILGERVGGTI